MDGSPKTATNVRQPFQPESRRGATPRKVTDWWCKDRRFNLGEKGSYNVNTQPIFNSDKLQISALINPEEITILSKWESPTKLRKVTEKLGPQSCCGKPAARCYLWSLSSSSFVSPQWDGAVRMWEHRQTNPLEEERERERDWQQEKDLLDGEMRRETKEKMSEEVTSPQKGRGCP